MSASSRKALTVYQKHRIRWSEGCGSPCCERAHSIVLAKGMIPCDILFVGEAPGQTEDVLGKPFTGPAGKLLDKIVSCALNPENLQRSAVGVPPVRVAFTNLVGCMPIDDETGNKSGAPDAEQQDCCRERLEEFIRICHPKIIVCVGTVSRDAFKPGYKHSVKLPGRDNHSIRKVYEDAEKGVSTGPHVIDIKHPSAILRAPFVEQEMMIKRCVITLRDTVETYLQPTGDS